MIREREHNPNIQWIVQKLYKNEMEKVEEGGLTSESFKMMLEANIWTTSLDSASARTDLVLLKEIIRGNEGKEKLELIFLAKSKAW